MGNIFSASEILEIGVQIEINGKDFYETIAAKTKSRAAKEIFVFLAGEEQRHIKVFEGMLASIGKSVPAESYPEEYAAYMKELASEHIFTRKDKGGEIAKAIKSDKEAVEKGIGFEKDSIIFYEGMKKAIPAYDQKPVDGLIEQEKLHLLKLTELLRVIK
ncbi:MAG: ferritin family protein [Candidatus Omnitrophica bacterium]|nr:ferritin family protein [Candidatus Omnitrophota bacterium]